MDLSGLESAEAIDTKDVRAPRFRIVWDHLGWFPTQVVPVLFPATNSADFTRVCKAVLAYTRSYVATTLDRRLTSLQGGVGNVRSASKVAHSKTAFR